MRRNLKEVLASQREMLRRKDPDADAADDGQMESLFRRELQSFYGWVQKQRHISMMDVDYNRILQNPFAELARVHQFLGGIVDLDAMVSVVDSNLYRNRSREAHSFPPQCHRFCVRELE